MIKYVIALFILLQVSFIGSAQDQDSNLTFKDRIYYGGGLGLTFGTITSININPMVGYKFTPKFSGGVSIMYQYFKRNDDLYDYESNSYGASVFSRYRIVEQLYAHVEYANINYDFFTINGEQAFRKWVPFLLVGGGYSSRVGSNTVLYAQVLFDVIQDQNSPYPKGQPIFSVGVGVGF